MNRPIVTLTRVDSRKRWVLRWIPAGCDSRTQETLPAGTNKRQAEMARADKQRELDDLFRRRADPHTWDGFTDAIWVRSISKSSRSNKQCFNAACSGLEMAARECSLPLASLDDVNSDLIDRWRTKLEREGKSESTVKTYTQTLLSALRKAEALGWMKQAPKVVRHRRERRGEVVPNRHVTGEEFDRWIACLRDYLGPDLSPSHEAACNAMFWGGLRLFEVLDLHWTDEQYHIPLLDRKIPCISFSPKQKNRIRQVVPIAPEFAQLLGKLQQDEGFVFALPNFKGKRYKTPEKLSGLYSKVSAKEKIWLGSRHATAKDFRKAAIRRWSDRMHWNLLAQMARHSDIATTKKHYIGEAIDESVEPSG